MQDTTKNIFDVILQSVAMIGAAFAFIIGMRQWRRDQAWKRAEQMDKLVQQFEQDPLLQLAATTIDWTSRTVRFRERDLEVNNRDALLALRDHTTMEKPGFDGEQATLRDAYDALLAFFCRLELALSTELVDVQPARKYFRYWLEHFIAFDRHPINTELLPGKTSPQMVAGYIRAYGDTESMRRLCSLFGVTANL